MSETKIRPLHDPEIASDLRSAGPREAVPQEALAAIREAATVEWQDVVRGRRSARRTRLMAAAALVAVALGVSLWAWRGTTVGAESVALVEAAPASTVWATGMPVSRGTVLAPETDLALRLAGGQSIRLQGGSEVRVAAADALELSRGTLYFDSAGAPAGTSLTVATPFGSVSDIGTQFELRLSEEELTVKVREGAVDLSAREAPIRIGQGEQLVLSSDGSVARHPVDRYGETWSWVVALAKPVEVEGLPLGDFLDWFSRETGQAIDYASADIETASRATVLHGSIEGLDPFRALDVVLASSGFTFEAVDGRIVLDDPS